MCCTKSETLNLSLCIIITTVVYYFVHFLILYVGTIAIYSNDYDMYSGCPKNMITCNNNERLTCYNEHIGECFGANFKFAFFYCPIIYIVSILFMSIIFGVIICIKRYVMNIYNECNDPDPCNGDELLPLCVNQQMTSIDVY